MKTKLNKWITYFFSVDMNDAINEGVISFAKIYGKGGSEEPKFFTSKSMRKECNNELKPN